MSKKTTGEVCLNVATNWMSIEFPEKPGEETLRQLRKEFKWKRARQQWIAKWTPEREDLACELTGCAKMETKTIEHDWEARVAYYEEKAVDLKAKARDHYDRSKGSKAAEFDKKAERQLARAEWAREQARKENDPNTIQANLKEAQLEAERVGRQHHACKNPQTRKYYKRKLENALLRVSYFEGKVGGSKPEKPKATKTKPKTKPKKEEPMQPHKTEEIPAAYNVTTDRLVVIADDVDAAGVKKLRRAQFRPLKDGDKNYLEAVWRPAREDALLRVVGGDSLPTVSHPQPKDDGVYWREKEFRLGIELRRYQKRRGKIAARWQKHVENRLQYVGDVLQELGEVLPEIEVGGEVLYKDRWHRVEKVNGSSLVLGDGQRIKPHRISAYRAPSSSPAPAPDRKRRNNGMSNVVDMTGELARRNRERVMAEQEERNEERHFTGEKYDPERTTKEIAVLVRQDIAAAIESGTLPGGKYSVRSRRGSVDITVKEIDPPVLVLNPERIRGDEGCPLYSEPGQTILDTLKAIILAYNYDKSEPESDYFDVAFYSDITFDTEKITGPQTKWIKSVPPSVTLKPKHWHVNEETAEPKPEKGKQGQGETPTPQPATCTTKIPAKACAVDRASFLEELILAEKFAERKTTIPGLETARLDLEDGCLRITTTDLECSVKAEVPVRGKGQGSVCIPAKRLLDVVKRLEGQDVFIEIPPEGDGGVPRINLATRRDTHFELVGFTTEDFPVTASVEKPQLTVTCDFQLFREAIKRVFPSICTEESRFQLSGFLLHVKDDGDLILSSTDGHRLSLANLEAEVDMGFKEVKMIIPRKVALELDRLKGSLVEEKLRIVTSEHHAEFRFGDRLIVCRLMEGNFPDYDRVIAKPKATVQLDRVEIEKAFDRSLLAFETAKDLVTKVTISDGSMTLESGTNGNYFCQTLGAKANGKKAPKEFEIGVNPQFVVATMRVLKKATKRFTLGVTDGNTQMTLVPETSPLKREVYVVMPIHL